MDCFKLAERGQELQHIPVHVMSGMNREISKRNGAFDF
jgi:hypothetical protein